MYMLVCLLACLLACLFACDDLLAISLSFSFDMYNTGKLPGGTSYKYQCKNLIVHIDHPICVSYMYVCMPACVSVVQSIYLSVPIYLSLCPSVCLYVSLSPICRSSIIHRSQHLSNTYRKHV